MSIDIDIKETPLTTPGHTFKHVFIVILFQTFRQTRSYDIQSSLIDFVSSPFTSLIGS